MIYVVSGYRRSGTSCMMHALHAGGLPVLVSETKEKIGATAEAGYKPNPSGLYEVGRGFYMNPLFLRKLPDGVLIKILFDGLPYLPQGSYKIIFMCRDEQDIHASILRAEQHLRKVGVPENKAIPTPFDVFRPYNEDDINHVINICEVRADIELIRVHYNHVLDSPVEVLESLQLPIDVDKAASVIDKKLCRFRHDDSKSRDAGRSPDCEDRASA